jgi:fucose permease
VPISRSPEPGGSYRRDSITWAAFGALFAFGFLNAVLGPALPYLRAVENISYLVGVLHQVAFAVGGGLAGLLAARGRPSIGRSAAVEGGLAGAALAALAVGYATAAYVSIAGAFLMSLLGTSALIRVWAALADHHGARRTVAMTEGEISVSLAGILTPLLIGALAATALSWRFAFVIGGATSILAALWVRRIGLPPGPRDSQPTATRTDRADGPWPHPTLIIVFAIVALEFTLSFWLASYLNDDLGLSRGAAAVCVSGLYASNLLGRLLASRLARRASAELLLAASLAAALIGLPFLLAANTAGLAAVGIAAAGIGVGAMFPLTSSLHVQTSPRSADSALGRVLTVASIGQIVGPFVAGVIAQVAGLRTGLLILPVLVLIAAAALYSFARGVPRARPE